MNIVADCASCPLNFMMLLKFKSFLNIIILENAVFQDAVVCFPDMIQPTDRN